MSHANPELLLPSTRGAGTTVGNSVRSSGDRAQRPSKGTRFEGLLSRMVLIGMGLTTIGCQRPVEPVAPPSTRDASVGRPEAPPGDSRVVAQVGDVAITADAVRAEMVMRMGDPDAGGVTLERKKAVLENLIRAEVLAQAAASAGYENDPEVVAAKRRLMGQRFWRDHMQNFAEQIPVTDGDVREYYERHKEAFREPERSRGSAILVRSDPSNGGTEAATREVAQALKEMRASSDPTSTFRGLAKRVSHDASSAERGGDMGWIVKGATTYRWEPKVVEALFALPEMGSVSDPIITSEGVVVVVLTGRDGGGIPPLPAVEQRIRVTLASTKGQEIDRREYERLRDGTRVEVDDAMLSSIGPDTLKTAGTGRPPSFPVGR